MVESSILKGLVMVFAFIGVAAVLGSVSEGAVETFNDGCAFALERNESGACVEVKEGWGRMVNESRVLEDYRRMEEYEPPPAWVKMVGPVVTVGLFGGLFAWADAMDRREDEGGSS